MRISLAVSALLSFAAARRNIACNDASTQFVRGGFLECCVVEEGETRQPWCELDVACEDLTDGKREGSRRWDAIKVGNCCGLVQEGEAKPEWCPTIENGRIVSDSETSEETSGAEEGENSNAEEGETSGDQKEGGRKGGKKDKKDKGDKDDEDESGDDVDVSSDSSDGEAKGRNKRDAIRKKGACKWAEINEPFGWGPWDTCAKEDGGPMIGRRVCENGIANPQKPCFKQKCNMDGSGELEEIVCDFSTLKKRWMRKVANSMCFDDELREKCEAKAVEFGQN